MSRFFSILGLSALAAVFIPGSLAGANRIWGPSSGGHVQAGPVFGAMSRMISWDDGMESTRLTVVSASVGAEFDLQWGITLGIRGGFSYSDYAGMFFRRLPFSLEYDAGGAEGILMNASLKKNLFSIGDFEIGVRGEFVYNIGLKKTWPLEGLAVPGEAVGEPHWMAGSAGPIVVYKGYENFSPRLTFAAEWFSGEFLMQQTVGDLRGSETKVFKGLGVFRIGAGADYQLSRNWVITGEAAVIPCREGVSTEIRAGILFSF